MATQIPTESRTHDEYTVGWICALSKEQTAAIAMLDQRHANLPKPPNDPNTYTLGSVGTHNIVIACLPEGKIGSNSAATVATWMTSTFPLIKVGLMVGIGGGIPPKVRLGDVVVSTPAGEYPGVVQWDFGKAEEGDKFKQVGCLNNPPTSILTALTRLKSENELSGSKIPEYLDELKQKWPRLVPKYTWSDSRKDPWAADSMVEQVGSIPTGDEGHRKEGDIRVHYGLIASGNQVIKEAKFRDKLNRRYGGNVLCVEMEAAGLMNNFPCIVIRGICDYADSQKNKDWQEYAAALAATFAKELLQYVQPADIDGERPVRDIIDQVRDAVSTIRGNTINTLAKLERKDETEILNWLTPIDYGLQQSDYLSIRQPTTGNWLLESDEFQSWLAASKQTLFCPGIPGAGKTILTSIVVDFLRSKFGNEMEVGVAYIYCNFRRQDEQKIHDLLASLLKQLAQCQPSLPESIKGLHSRHKTKRTRPSLDEISTLLQLVVSTYSRVFIIVDALDECQTDYGCRTRFLSEVFKLQEMYGISIFATSRFVPDITDCFQQSLSKEIRASAGDVARYLQDHIGQLPFFVQQNQKLKEEILTGISQAVDGMFLLAYLYLDSLRDKLTPNGVRSAIKGFGKQSQGLGEYQQNRVLNLAYEQAMKRINRQTCERKALAMEILLWITFARRELTILELQHALAVKPERHELDNGDLPHARDMVSICAGLVTVDEESDVIRLVHYTTQEYLQWTQNRWFQNPDSLITTTCITYLSFTVFESGFCKTDHEFEERLKLYPFYKYAACNWAHHAPKLEAPSQVINFLRSHTKVEASTQAFMVAEDHKFTDYSQIFPKKMMGLHLAGYFGVIKAVDELLRLEQSPDLEDTYGRTPLWYAAQHGHVAVVKTLQEAGADINTASTNEWGERTALYVAAESGHLEMAETLLAAGADIDAVSTTLEKRTALVVAIERGRLEIVDKLLAAGANVNAGNDGIFGLTALHAAAEQGYLELVEQLLEAGADVNAVSDHLTASQTALEAAARRGHLAIVEKLLAAGADVHAYSDRLMAGETALQAAARGGHLEIIEKLLEAGANIDFVSSHLLGRTALQAAACRGNLNVVEELLAAGADVNDAARLYEGQTPLEAAARGGNLDVVDKLLVAGAKINDYAGQVALKAAAEGEHIEVIEKLWKVGANIDAAVTTGGGQAELQAAINRGDLLAIRRLFGVKSISLAGSDIDPIAFEEYWRFRNLS
ncbi:hypothetical protein BGZ63DRAFT_360315 [Mariannaea sp. PMI_226]|nr:hypothetical protein BGZ63DRAFT_360315 [Mariannaea sp. PMI_226]